MSTPHTTLLLACLLHATLVHSHGYMAVPNPRGVLERIRTNPNAPEIMDDGEVDFKPHFPAGDKDEVPGSGKRSQEIAAGPRGWVPYTPLEPNFRWRAGVCGDMINGPHDHLRGGRFYNGGHIVANYTQGQTIEIELNIIAHHNGFMELHVCDVAKCGGEISRACFVEGHCRMLTRTRGTKCESGNNIRCGPIDRNYPGRWYFPCSDHYFRSNDIDFFGGDGTILYDLPADLHCEHCVLQWFWSSANTCNPVGVVEYFDGPDAPNWGSCRGQGEAFGGVARRQGDCGDGDRFPEEYLSCSDIRITPRNGGGGNGNDDGDDEGEDDDDDDEEYDTDGGLGDRSGSMPAPTRTRTPTPRPSRSGRPSPTPTRTPTPVPSRLPMASPTRTPTPAPRASQMVEAPPRRNRRTGVIEDVVLVGDGEVVRSVNDADVVDISGYRQIAIECITTRAVQRVEFYLNARLVWTDFFRPYFMFGNKNREPNYWSNPPIDRQFWLKTLVKERGGNTTDVIRLTFTRG